MRLRANIAACLLALAGATSLFSQIPESAPLSGTLTVWVVVHNPNPRPRNRVGSGAAPSVPQYQEKTMGEFGQTAGSVGQTAGSVGQTAGSFGQTAGSTGEPAGNTGQTAGSFGTTASSVGKNAGDAGQTVGSFGTSTSDLAAVASASNMIRTFVPKRDAQWDGFLRSVDVHFPQLRVRSEDVFDDELPVRLEAVAGTTNAPDILVGSPLPTGWSRLNGGQMGRYGVVSRVQAVYHPQTEYDSAVPRPRFDPEATILEVGGRGSSAARAMYLWMEDGGERTVYQASSADGSAAIKVAEQIFRSSLGDGGDANVQVDATAGHIRNGFAVLALRAVLSGQREFGVAYGLVVLTKNEGGRWVLLQVSPYLTQPMQRNAYDVLMKATLGKEESNPLANEAAKPMGISQAAPADGDSRAPQPQLWWDNKGGASLQVVEWSMGDGATDLFFVRDANPHLRTAVVARFARVGGRYRWRVWSIGADGAVVLSPWRTMLVVGH